MGNRPSIDLVSRRGGLVVYSRVNLNKPPWCARLSEDRTAEFLTKTEPKKSKISQNILLYGCYLFVNYTIM